MRKRWLAPYKRSITGHTIVKLLLMVCQRIQPRKRWMVYNNLFILSFINLFEIELPSCIVCIVLISLGFYMFLSYLLFTFFFCRTVSLGLSIPASVSVNESDTVQIRCSVLGGETDVMFNTRVWERLKMVSKVNRTKQFSYTTVRFFKFYLIILVTDDRSCFIFIRDIIVS